MGNIRITKVETFYRLSPRIKFATHFPGCRERTFTHERRSGWVSFPQATNLELNQKKNKIVCMKWSQRFTAAPQKESPGSTLIHL